MVCFIYSTCIHTGNGIGVPLGPKGSSTLLRRVCKGIVVTPILWGASECFLVFQVIQN